MAISLKKHILFTGGGSPGHVTPNIALIKQGLSQGWDVSYIGSYGIEQTLIKPLNIPYFNIQSGKLRRYFSWKNFTDPFKILMGIIQSYFLLRKIKPDVVFSKGGFVAVPVVIAAWLRRIPVVVHESDFSPGLANKLSYPFARKIALSFQATEKYFKNKNKLIWTGTPLRQELFLGNAEKGRALCGFTSDKKVLLVMGGGLGAQKINEVIRATLPHLIDQYQVIHLCGKGKTDAAFDHKKDYKQFDYVDAELPDLLAAADVVVSRAGANALSELWALHKLNILIPLTKGSRGDQLLNAAQSKKMGLSLVIQEDDLSSETLLKTLTDLTHNQKSINTALNAYVPPDGITLLYDTITVVLKD